MTRRKITDEQYGKLQRRLEGLRRRIDEGTIPFDLGMQKLQTLIEEGVRLAFDVVVDYSRSLAQMVEAGEYDWVNSNISEENFPIEGDECHELRIVLFHFGRVMDSDEVVAIMKREGFRPAKIEELLALGEAHPNLQKEFPIVGLGSVWQDRDGLRHVPHLYKLGSKRYLYLYWFEYRSNAYCHFAGLRK